MEFDPLSERALDDPHGLYTELRQGCPVAHSERWNGFWALFRYEDIREVLRDSRTFVTSVQNVVPKVAFTGRRPPLHLDPPEHTPYRRALNPLLTRARAAVLEPGTREHARSLLAGLTGRAGPADLSAEYAARIPIYTFARFLNVSDADMEAIKDAWLRYNRALQDADDEQVKAQSLVLYAIARDLVDARRRDPADPAVDPVTALLAARHKGEPLPAEMIVGTVRQVMVTGMVAPTVTLGSMVAHLAGDPELQDRLRAASDLVPRAVEEFLRLYSPYRGFARTAVRDVEIGGREIRAGEPIALVFTSANRDESVFTDPARFDLDRPPGRHLAFGQGPHMCAGVELARMELRVGLTELLAATRGFELAGTPEMTRWPEYGPVGLPVNLH
ncbi:cytochrome P450 [Actinomadura craniellae]|uniref:Cytochrome P450 n=1 Tax=Actinomadura craniellae TaxID=2231787 RepID=A0A365HA48_9ACTN|nr:cytochrome P450 [Actinomadura craniellae]RAY15878.1 cytochrome P450 [Actinomadura craniellae]